MNTREAYQALLDGKEVMDVDGDIWSMDEDGDLLLNGHWTNARPKAFVELHVEPATDEELIAEMERRADSNHGRVGTAAAAYHLCAELLRTRKIPTVEP